MRNPRRHLRAYSALWAVPLAASFALAAPGCGDAGEHHEDAGRIEIETRGSVPTVLAVWTDDGGWEDADGNDIDELPTPVQAEDGSLSAFEAYGERTSLSVNFFDRDGDAVEMETLDRDDDTGERECSEFSARYFSRDDDTGVIAWPNVTHPDSDGESYQFVELSDGDFAGIYHCDHVHIYPKEEGTVDIEFVLWHGDHADDLSDPLTIRVEEASDDDDNGDNDDDDNDDDNGDNDDDDDDDDDNDNNY